MDKLQQEHASELRKYKKLLQDERNKKNRTPITMPKHLYTEKDFQEEQMKLKEANLKTKFAKD